MPAGHGWETILDDEQRRPGHFLVQRYHVRPATRSAIGDEALQIDIMASETVPALRPADDGYSDPHLYERADAEEDPDAPSTTTPPQVAVGWPERPVDLDADDARRLAVAVAADLRVAALELDRIAGRE